MAGTGDATHAALDDSWRFAAGVRRAVIIAVAVALIVVIHPWRSVDNATDVEAAQQLVDAMVSGRQAIIDGSSEPSLFSMGADGFVGGRVATLSGDRGIVLIAPIEGSCMFMHWVEEASAQVGRLSPELPCELSSITEVPVLASDGYVPGTGPPFDVTRLVLEAYTPVWYLAALVLLAWIAIRAGLDVVLIVFRPDHLRRKR